MARDVEMRDDDAVAEEALQYGNGQMTEDELNQKYPNRPHNHSKSLPFHELFTDLFNPLVAARKKPTGPPVARKKVGPHGPQTISVSDQRYAIIDRFVKKWRQKVGNDFYPAMRLILPDKDRDRAMYGLKEKGIAKLLIKVIGINKNSVDADALTNWKLPGQRTSATAGDFAARCLEILEKRPIRTKPGTFTVAEVNALLDQLSMLSKDEEQIPIFEDFYRQMNPEELMWLIRIILRQMKIGATEKTFLDRWHPDAENLFNVSSSLRRVCWELHDPSVSLHQEKSQITLMQCFQPQLAAFQLHSFKKILEKMRPEDKDDTFWIEEKLDGERMQLHMMQDKSMPGGVRFGFWSRKAKDYTYLYGNGYEDDNSALTRHLKQGFDPSVRNIILDGEMITWSMDLDTIKAFGTLKTAALSEQKNPFRGSERPVFRVFDCLYLNDQPLTRYTLRDRRQALEKSVKSVHRRMEIHDYAEATTTEDIDAALRKIVAESSEGLVVKSPRSRYRHERADDWIKVKPEYMNEFGEDLDCIVIGGYYGSGHRGGRLSSFLCGLRVDAAQIEQGANPQKCWSFFKVGGGFSAEDYAEVYRLTEGKWHNWNSKKPPIEYVELGGGDRQFEKPDRWIKPEDSVVVAVKAASVSATDQFRTKFTLRFPRFKSLRRDKGWEESLTIMGFYQLRSNAEKERKDKDFEVEKGRKPARTTKRIKKVLQVVGTNEFVNQYASPDTQIFKGMTFFVLSASTQPEKKTKAEVEAMVKSNGGHVVQSLQENVICISESRTLKASAVQKDGKHNIIKPAWLFDCVEQAKIDSGRPRFLLPYEPCHMFYTLDTDREMIESNIDEYGDSFCRDLTIRTLQRLCDTMPPQASKAHPSTLFQQLDEHGVDNDDLPAIMFRRATVYFDRAEDTDLDMDYAQHIVHMTNGTVVGELDHQGLTHVVVGENCTRLVAIRKDISSRKPVPRIVTVAWVTESFKEKTLLDEDRFAVAV